MNKGIKPIIGVETYVARRSMTDKEGKADAQPFHLILLASDLIGYRNLCRLVTDAHIDGYYYKPRIDREHLAKHSEGLIGLSACLNGEVARALEVDDWDLARSVAGEYGDIFGKDRFFLELQDHGLAEQRRLNEQLLRLAPEAGLPLVVTNDLHYVRREQAPAHDVLLCVGTGIEPRHAGPAEVRDRRLLPQVGGRDGGPLSRPARGAHQHEADRRDVRPEAAARPDPDPALPGARRRDARVVARGPSASAAWPGATGPSPRSSRRASSTSSASSPRWATRATS